MKARKYFEQHRLSVIVGIVMTAVLVIGLAIIIPLGIRGSSPATTPTPTPTTGVVTPAPTTGAVTSTPSPATTPTPTATPGENTPTPEPGVVWGPQACPAGISDPAHWDTILGTGSDSNVEGISCANILGNPSLQALVTVRHSDAKSTLDVYVFTHITSAKPTQLFKLPGLVQGYAKISGYNSVMTAQVDQNSSVNVDKPGSQWTRDLFREFEWNAGKGTLVHVAFPGIFPDLTRYQAEQDQARVNQGKDTWKNDPKQVAKKLGAKFFGWTLPSTATLIKGGGAKDVYATVKVVENAPGTKPPSINVTLTRLEGNTHNMWVVIGVESGSGVLTSVGSRSLIASPVKLEGKGNSFEGVIGEGYILDHLYTVVGQAQLTAIPGIGMGISPYSVQASYDTSFKGGPQEGVVEVQLTNSIGIGPYATVMVKVLLDPQPRVVLGPVSCPIKIGNQAHWEPILGLDTSKFSIGTISCANMKGDPSLQAVIPVYHTDSSQMMDVYVYDKITSTHPVQLFKLPGLFKGGAMMSGYSTLLTAQVDQNSSINNGKSEDQVTADLFREFQWSKSAGAFAPVAFPGIFPDLTRWQAEQDQILVTLGQNTWKNDPKQVALKLGQKFFSWKTPYKATLISGGGAKDVYATVKVEATPFPEMKAGPSVAVTLSRLEGNTHNMWVAIAVEDGAGALTNLKAGSLIASPVKLEGKGGAFEGLIGHAYILDHLYTTVGHAMLTAIPGLGMGESPYSVQVSYDTSFKQGTQEGVVEIAMTSPVGGPYVMVKVLLDPQPRVALGPVSCPLAIQQAGYWDSIIGIDKNVSSVGMVSCGNLKGDPSLQALVPVYHPDSQTVDVYAYDHITGAHPVQLFRLLGLNRGSTMISGASTVLTAQVDPNSNINKGKSGDQLTIDLYREFQWDGKSGTFVQIVFPGMYPDLTRWQAEVAQDKVALQQDTWKLDAMKTAERFIAQFLPTAPTNQPPQLQLVSGGGTHDLTARVNASFSNGKNFVRATKITLKRLEGNVNGIWEVTAVQADWMYISSPQSGPATHISNPVTVSGYGPQFESQVGTVHILDHLYTSIGSGYAMGSAGFGPGPFTVKVPYQASFQAGAQEGIVELVHTGGASFDYGVVLVKVLVNP
jgi:hypothetical protein